MFRLLFTICILLLLHQVATTTVIKIPEDYDTIQAGINVAVNGDTVLVADSTYYENIDFKGKAITVASYFLIDGDTNHIDSTIINGSQPQDADKGSVVSFVSGEDTTSILCGFTITGGTGTLYDAMFRVGGGVYLKLSGACIVSNKIISNNITHDQKCLGGGIGSSPEHSNSYIIIGENIITSNILNAQNGSSGGGIFLYQTGQIIYNTINNNLSTGGSSFHAFGGGVSLHCDTTIARLLVTITGNYIANNEAVSDYADGGGNGGGIDAQFCNIILLNNTIDHNSVRGPNPGGGAGVYLIYIGPSTIKNNTITSNSSTGQDGSLLGFGGGLCSWNSVDLLIENNLIEANVSVAGGGISLGADKRTMVSNNSFLYNISMIGGGIYAHYLNESIISSNKFTVNSAEYYGGAIFIEACSPALYNNIIVNNKALYNGGGIFVTDQNCQPQIINNSIVADTAGLYGGGICVSEASPIIMNTIIWGNDAPSDKQLSITSGDTLVAYCDVEDDLWMGEGNISADPQLVADSLADSSPCIGTGINAFDFGNSGVYHCPEEDINGRLRPSPSGSIPDMGAWESLLDTALVGGIESMPIATVPQEYSLSQNYPNPFNAETVIRYMLPVTCHLDLSIYNLIGQKVATLVSKKQQAGKYQVKWNAADFSSGFYFYRINAGNFSTVKKCLILK